MRLDERDSDWLAERQSETLRAIGDVEKRTLFANILASAAIIGLSQTLPNATAFYLPALLRFVVIFLSAIVYNRIRRELGVNAPTMTTIYFGVFVSLLGGLSWGLLLLPVIIEPVLHAASFMIFGAILVCVGLISSNTSSAPHMWVPFILSFLASTLAGLAMHAGPLALQFGLGLTIVVAVLTLFSFGTAKQSIRAADMLVENRRLGEELADALSHAEFLAKRDPLTGLYNRRAVFEYRTHENARNDRAHVMLIDIDRFKQVNDRFGHDLGDRLLVAIATVIRATLRELPGETHYAARLGGEEFAIFLDLSEEAEASAFAECVRMKIERVAFEFSMPEGLATASIGLSHLDRGEPIAHCLQRADTALYEAKNAGRNTVRSRDRELAA
ncbi:GGDEF domain-containing protein [Qipengyuania aquimaris]|uniref:GGDEF domain-containing protein n=1 Tax=Qipengyuania aquimaris TaxID=255984 RepID=UPI001C93DFBA|nr:GGDEF domain-containing protein [Qipengyuania aquimaris]MBY6128540.1 GGDEF domain-containing protein [Qipengyuania aquimaris]